MRIYLYHIIFYTVNINYVNYISVILVLLAYSHKYSARINNQLYDICIMYGDLNQYIYYIIILHYVYTQYCTIQYCTIQ